MNMFPIDVLSILLTIFFNNNISFIMTINIFLFLFRVYFYLISSINSEVMIKSYLPFSRDIIW